MKKEDLIVYWSENPSEETINNVRRWIRINLEKRKGFKCKNRPSKSRCEYTLDDKNSLEIGYISKRTFMECLLDEGYDIKDYDTYEINCVFKKNATHFKRYSHHTNK